MSPYAEGTTVTPDRSRAELERILTRHGARGFLTGWDDTRALIGFIMRGRQVRVVVPLPSPEDRKYRFTPETRVVRSAPGRRKAYEADVRQRWRALVLVVKAKLEAVEAGIVTFEQEFALQFVLPDGTTVGDGLLPRLDAALEGSTTDLLPALPPAAHTTPAIEGPQ